MVTGIITSFHLLQKLPLAHVRPYSWKTIKTIDMEYEVWLSKKKKKKVNKIYKSVRKVYEILHVILCICIEGGYNSIQFRRVKRWIPP